jgi:hypothetical protein
MTGRKSDWLILLGRGRATYRGKRPAGVESFERNMSSIQREVTGLYAKRGNTSHANGP